MFWWLNGLLLCDSCNEPDMFEDYLQLFVPLLNAEIKHKENLSLIIILKKATNQKEVVITNCKMIKCTFSLWVFFFGFEPLNTRVSFFHWCEILVSHCDTIFLFQHAFTLPFIVMFNFMDDSKFMTILHQFFLPSKTFYYNYN